MPDTNQTETETETETQKTKPHTISYKGVDYSVLSPEDYVSFRTWLKSIKGFSKTYSIQCYKAIMEVHGLRDASPEDHYIRTYYKRAEKLFSWWLMDCYLNLQKYRGQVDYQDDLLRNAADWVRENEHNLTHEAIIRMAAKSQEQEAMINEYAQKIKTMNAHGAEMDHYMHNKLAEAHDQIAVLKQQIHTLGNATPEADWRNERTNYMKEMQRLNAIINKQGEEIHAYDKIHKAEQSKSNPIFEVFFPKQMELETAKTEIDALKNEIEEWKRANQLCVDQLRATTKELQRIKKQPMQAASVENSGHVIIVEWLNEKTGCIERKHFVDNAKAYQWIDQNLLAIRGFGAYTIS